MSIFRRGRAALPHEFSSIFSRVVDIRDLANTGALGSSKRKLRNQVRRSCKSRRRNSRKARSRRTPSQATFDVVDRTPKSGQSQAHNKSSSLHRPRLRPPRLLDKFLPVDDIREHGVHRVSNPVRILNNLVVAAARRQTLHHIVFLLFGYGEAHPRVGHSRRRHPDKPRKGAAQSRRLC
jgi:hypothetical protein